MFGKTIDYWLLRPFAHGRHPEAEELRQLERDLGIESATARFEKWNRRLDNEIPIEPDMRYLDVGCGMGEVERPGDCLRRMDGVLKSKSPGGVIIMAFGPLFHSPFGDHLNRFFRFRIPWMAVLFSEDALMRLRREFWRPVADEAESFEDTREGLNKMKFSEFLRYVEEMGWKKERLIVNPQLKRWPALWRLSNLLLRVPVLRDYLAASVYAIYQRP